MAADARLVPAGPAGGPVWTLQQEALLFDSLESGLPIGYLLVWVPTGSPPGRWHVLDGHRRVHALRHAHPDVTTHLVRDLTEPEPTYRQTDGVPARDWNIPVGALLRTVPFLRATRAMPPHIATRADTAAARLLRARIDVVTVNGGTTDSVRVVCERLALHRVTRETLHNLPA